MNFCTCRGGDSPVCSTCRAIESITHQIKNDEEELADLDFTDEEYVELAGLARRAYLSGNWAEHNARHAALLDEAIATRARGLLSAMRELGMAA